MSTGTDQTLPSPSVPVRAAVTTASISRPASSSAARTSGADLGRRAERVPGTPWDLGVAGSAAVAVGLRDGETVRPEGLEGVPDLVEPVRADDGGDELHAVTFLVSARPARGASLVSARPARGAPGAVGTWSAPPPAPLKS